jgi:hypothetical protein
MNRFEKRMMPLLLAGTFVAFAQVPRGPHAPANAPHTGLNMAALQVIQGAVTDVDIARGAQYPTVVVNKLQIKLAPEWYLLDNDIEIKTGDTLKITAAGSSNPADTYLYAIDIAKGSAFLQLRDSQGFPLWTGGPGRGNGRGQGTRPGSGECQGCLDAASIATVTGTVDKVTAGAGIQFPSVVLKAADNKLLAIKIGPERVLLAADFEIAAGQTLTVKYAASTCKDEFVALELIDSNGRKLVLREQDGTPSWN